VTQRVRVRSISGVVMDELIEVVQRQAGISRDQAKLAVSAMVAFFSAKLPSPLVGRMQSLLDNPHESNRPDTGAI
jgi:hypothetical protein